MARPLKPLLSQDRILQAALGQLDRTGRLSMPELAQELGVSVSSLYHHVDGRKGVLEGVRGIISGWDYTPAGDWADSVCHWARHYRDAFAGHPNAIPTLIGQTITAPGTLRHYDSLAEVLRTAGFSAQSVVLSISSLDALCLGAALDAAAPSIVWSSAESSPSEMQDAVANSGLGSARSNTAFELHLSWLITGMRTLLNDVTPGEGGAT